MKDNTTYMATLLGVLVVTASAGSMLDRPITKQDWALADSLCTKSGGAVQVDVSRRSPVVVECANGTVLKAFHERKTGAQ